ncbi:hypothetical protein F53441_8395 [Fusarium austroafricanum]|uniref:Uncharacterized protein n=1 Tax=Fusarium austroafricanum TaxID=2364996 RepID=A0A8H4KDD8_9HYPO|nr:hypothetical protein F53441_8395 [Fusarium austroafricanum]
MVVIVEDESFPIEDTNDGDKDDSSIEDISHDIYNATNACRSALQNCLSIKPLVMNGWAENRLADFNLWAAGVGALAKTKASLDWRLHYQPKARIVLVSLLITLRDFIEECKDRGLIESGNESLKTTCAEFEETKFLEDSEIDRNEINTETKAASAWFDALPSGSEDSDSSSMNTEDDGTRDEDRSLNEAMEATEDILDQLIRLGFAIRKSGTNSRLRKADASFEGAIYEGLKRHLAIVLLTGASRKDDNSRKTTFQRVIDFQRGYEELTSEQRQLIDANVRRRHRFNYARRHHKKLEEPPDLKLFPTVKPVVETIDFQETMTTVEKARPSFHTETPKYKPIGAPLTLAISATTVSTVQGDILSAPTPSQVSSRVTTSSVQEKVTKWVDGMESADFGEESFTLKFMNTESFSETPDNLYVFSEYFAECSEDSSRAERESELSDSNLPTPSFDSTFENSRSPAVEERFYGALEHGSEEQDSHKDEQPEAQKDDRNSIDDEPRDPMAIDRNEVSIERLQALLLYTARDGQASQFDWILRSGRVNVNTPNTYGETPLLVAAGFGLQGVVRTCLDHNANINVEDAMGRTPLSLAAGFGDIKVTRMLLEAGAVVDAKDNMGRTPLSIAVYNRNEDIVRLLLEFGADINTTNKKDQTLLDNATGTKIADLLRGFGEVEES